MTKYEEALHLALFHAALADKHLCEAFLQLGTQGPKELVAAGSEVGSALNRITALLGAQGQARFPMVSCSQCGRGFGPGEHGFSSCQSHAHLEVVED